MNAQRRQEIDSVRSTLVEIIDRLETLATNEQEAFDNLHESLQQGEKGQAMDEAAQSLGNAASEAQNCLDSLESIE